MTGYGWQRTRGTSGPRRWISSCRTTTTVFAACSAVGASLLTGCGVLPGVAGGSREPITVMTWAPDGTSATNAPGMPALAKAFARWVNANGGLGGHELTVLTCNDHNTPVGASDCARRAVKEKAVAVVGSYSQYGSAFMPPLEVAGIPYLGGYGISDQEFTNALSYPVNGGQAALIAGSGRQLAQDCDQVSLVRPDTIAGDVLPTVLNAGLLDAHRAPAADIRTAEDAGDYTAEARRALAGVLQPLDEDATMLAVVTPERISAFRSADGDLRWLLPAREGCAFDPARTAHTAGVLLLGRPCRGSRSWSQELVAVDDLGEITPGRTPLGNDLPGGRRADGGGNRVARPS